MCEGRPQKKETKLGHSVVKPYYMKLSSELHLGSGLEVRGSVDYHPIRHQKSGPVFWGKYVCFE